MFNIVHLFRLARVKYGQIVVILSGLYFQIFGLQSRFRNTRALEGRTRPSIIILLHLHDFIECLTGCSSWRIIDHDRCSAIVLTQPPHIQSCVRTAFSTSQLQAVEHVPSSRLAILSALDRAMTELRADIVTLVSPHIDVLLRCPDVRLPCTQRLGYLLHPAGTPAQRETSAR